jgi:hypothetical protein
MVPFADVSNTRGVSKAEDTTGHLPAKRTPGPVGNLIWLAVHRESGDAVVQRGNFSGSLVGRLSIYFGRGQRSRQKFGHCGSKLTFCGGLLLRDFRSASSTTWYSLVSIGCFQRFAALVSRQFGGNNRTHKQNTNDAHWDRHLNKCPLGCWIEPGATHQGPIKKLLPKENSARED